MVEDGRGYRVEEDKEEEKKYWDTCNSTFNKIYLKNKVLNIEYTKNCS